MLEDLYAHLGILRPTYAQEEAFFDPNITPLNLRPQKQHCIPQQSARLDKYFGHLHFVLKNYSYGQIFQNKFKDFQKI